MYHQMIRRAQFFNFKNFSFEFVIISIKSLQWA